MSDTLRDTGEYGEPDTYLCGKIPTGYKGQRYQVSYSDKTGEHIMGWTNDPSGGSLAESINLHPSWHSPKVEDLDRTEA